MMRSNVNDKPAEPNTVSGKAKETAATAWDATKHAAETVREKTVDAAHTAKQLVFGRDKDNNNFVRPTTDNFSTEHPVIVGSSADVPRSAPPQTTISAPAGPNAHA